MFQAYIKIHSVVLQKGLTYKRLFHSWRDQKSKCQPFRLQKEELAAGLKKLKAGLTQDEITQLCAAQVYEGRDNAIAFNDFEDKVKSGAQTLQSEQSFERMLLTDWIMQFNETMQRNQFPFDKLFAEHDSQQIGGLTFEDFANLNERVEVSFNKQDLKRVFEIIDKNKSGKVTMDEVRGISSMTMAPDLDETTPQGGDPMDLPEEDLRGDDILVRQQINDIYSEIKGKLEEKNATLESIFYAHKDEETKKGQREHSEPLQPNQLATKKGISKSFEHLKIILTQLQAERILKDVRNANHGKFEVTYKDVIDFMTRKRINVAFLEKGFVDPILASTCT